MRTTKILLTLCLVLLIGLTDTFAQKDPPRLSPKAFVGQTVGYTDVVINYGRPGVKGRQIWGELVPLGEIWRTGANEATTIEFSGDVLVNGKEVPAGKYSLFTIPREERCTVIINKVADQWGAYNYDESEDLIRFDVKPKKSDFTERLLVTFDYSSDYAATVIFEWENFELSFEINTKTEN